jgi:hypothetical protein
MRINQKLERLKSLETTIYQTTSRARTSIDIIDGYFNPLFEMDKRKKDSHLDYLIKDLEQICKRFSNDAENKWGQILNHINKF